MTGYQKRRSWLSGGRFYEVQPTWSKKLVWYVGFPSWLVWGWLIISDNLNEYRALALVDFGVFFGVGAVANFFFVRSLLRGDL